MVSATPAPRTRPALPRTVASLALLALMLLPALLAGGAAAASTAPRITFGHGHGGGGGGGGSGGCSTPPSNTASSSNWGGYAAMTCVGSPASGAVSDVKGSWTEPSVSCAPRETSYAAFWVGIDGYSSSSVEQLGTDSDCANGAPQYYAWYEMYPAYPVNLLNPVSPGDSFSAEVSYSAGGFTLSITDHTAGWSNSTFHVYSAAARSSAEWIDEAPSSGHVLPLADFGTVTFTDCTATINSTSGPISDSAWQYSDLTMATRSTVKSTTSALDPTGTSFTATWQHS